MDLVCDIVVAYVSHNSLPRTELADLISSVHSALRALSGELPSATPETTTKEPAVPIRKSVQQDFIICLEDGKKFKSLKRHLRSAYDLSPDAYRAKWGLKADYPMVAPAYAASRSALAKSMGLGQSRLKSAKQKAVPKSKRAKATA